MVKVITDDKVHYIRDEVFKSGIDTRSEIGLMAISEMVIERHTYRIIKARHLTEY